MHRKPQISKIQNFFEFSLAKFFHLLSVLKPVQKPQVSLKFESCPDNAIIWTECKPNLYVRPEGVRNYNPFSNTPKYNMLSIIKELFCVPFK